MKSILLIVSLCLNACATVSHQGIGKIVGSIDGKEMMSGSGFAVSYHLVVTAAHVCAAIDDGASLIYQGHPVMRFKVDVDKDLCLLYSPKRLPDYLNLAFYAPKIDDSVTIVGYPLGIDVQIVTYGEFAGEMVLRGHKRSVLSCQAYAGNSGGPILNSFGQVIGVMHAGAPMYPQLSIAINYEDLKKFLSEAY